MEILKYREMNTQLKNLREQHETKVNRFEKDKRDFEQYKQTETEQLKRNHDEHMKKIEIERKQMLRNQTVNNMLPNKA